MGLEPPVKIHFLGVIDWLRTLATAQPRLLAKSRRNCLHSCLAGGPLFTCMGHGSLEGASYYFPCWALAPAKASAPPAFSGGQLANGRDGLLNDDGPGEKKKKEQRKEKNRQARQKTECLTAWNCVSLSSLEAKVTLVTVRTFLVLIHLSVRVCVCRYVPLLLLISLPACNQLGVQCRLLMPACACAWVSELGPVPARCCHCWSPTGSFVRCCRFVPVLSSFFIQSFCANHRRHRHFLSPTRCFGDYLDDDAIPFSFLPFPLSPRFTANRNLTSFGWSEPGLVQLLLNRSSLPPSNSRINHRSKYGKSQGRALSLLPPLSSFLSLISPVVVSYNFLSYLFNDHTWEFFCRGSFTESIDYTPVDRYSESNQISR